MIYDIYLKYLLYIDFDTEFIEKINTNKYELINDYYFGVLFIGSAKSKDIIYDIETNDHKIYKTEV